MTKKGFTIIELLIYQGLLVVFLVVLMEIFLSSIDVHLGQQSTSNIEQDGRYLISRLIYDINRASVISQPPLKGTPASALQLTAGLTTSTYSQNGPDLILTSAGNSDQLNSYNTTVSNLNFLRLGNLGGAEDTITVSFTLTSKVALRNNFESRDFQTTISKRRN